MSKIKQKAIAALPAARLAVEAARNARNEALSAFINRADKDDASVHDSLLGRVYKADKEYGVANDAWLTAELHAVD